MFRNLVTIGSALGLAPLAHADCADALAPFVADAGGSDTGAVRATVASNQANGVVSASSGAQLYSDGIWLTTFLLPDAEGIDVAIKLDGSEVHLRHRGWVDTVILVNPTCEENVIYGFGTPVGRATTHALYVVSLQQAEVTTAP